MTGDEIAEVDHAGDLVGGCWRMTEWGRLDRLEW